MHKLSDRIIQSGSHDSIEGEVFSSGWGLIRRRGGPEIIFGSRPSKNRASEAASDFWDHHIPLPPGSSPPRQQNKVTSAKAIYHLLSQNNFATLITKLLLSLL